MGGAAAAPSSSRNASAVCISWLCSYKIINYRVELMIMVYVGVSLVSAVVAKITLDKSFYQLIMRED
jgi:hypothetical protein